MIWFLFSSPVAHHFGVLHFRFLRILSHYVTELALIFSEHPCHMQDTEFDTHVHGHAHGSLPSLATHLPHRLDSLLLFLLLFMPSRPFPSNKEMIRVLLYIYLH